MRILVVQTAFIGDVILATALLEQLHTHYPTAQLDLLVRKGNETLLTEHPFLHRILVWDKKKAKYSNLVSLLNQIRRTKYDVVLNLQRFGATGLLTALSGATRTIGFDKNPFSRLFKYRVPHRIEPGIHEVGRNAQLLLPLGLPINTSLRPQLYPTPADYEAISPYQIQSYICLAPTSVWFTKQYPVEHWIQFVKHVPSSTTVYLLGAPTDVPTCAQIQQQADRRNVVNLAGKLSLLQSAALMQSAQMNYVNDSAPLHLCSAVNAPTTAIFCSTVPSFGFGPLADVAHIIETPESLDCRPCGLHGYRACPLGHFRCATTIDPIRLIQVGIAIN